MMLQVVMGHEFKGEAFKPTPSMVLFKDFEVGQTYRLAITITNISLARNTFKVSPSPHSFSLLLKQNLKVMIEVDETTPKGTIEATARTPTGSVLC